MPPTPARRPDTTPTQLVLPSLSRESLAAEGDDALVMRAAAYMREYIAVEARPTILLMNIAAVLVELRSRTTTDDGRTDWRGRSVKYRQEANQIYAAAGVSVADRERVSRAVRWHVGNLLREVMTPQELADYDLQESSPLDRLRDSQASTAAIVSAARAEIEAATASVPTVKATADHVRLGVAVTNILGQLSVDVISETMTDGQRAKLDEELEEAQQKLRILRRYTKKRSSGA